MRDLQGLPPEILLVPLAGHTWGHSGIAIDTGRGWLLHAADAYFHRDEVRRPRLRCPPGKCGYQRIMEVDRRARLDNQARLWLLAAEHAEHVRIFCVHDRLEFEGFSGSAARPDGANPSR